MSKFNVSVYAVARVKIENIQAESHLEAMVRAENAVDYHKLLDRDLVVGGSTNEQGDQTVVYAAFAEEFVGYLVDEHGDPEYLKSVSYGADRERAPTQENPVDMPRTLPTEQDADELARKMYLHDDPDGHWTYETQDEKDCYLAYARIALGLKTTGE